MCGNFEFSSGIHFSKNKHNITSGSSSHHRLPPMNFDTKFVYHCSDLICTYNHPNCSFPAVFFPRNIQATFQGNNNPPHQLQHIPFNFLSVRATTTKDLWRQKPSRAQRAVFLEIALAKKFKEQSSRPIPNHPKTWVLIELLLTNRLRVASPRIVSFWAAGSIPGFELRKTPKTKLICLLAKCKPAEEEKK